MIRSLLATTVALAVFFPAFCATNARAADDPIARTRALVEAFKAVKKPAAGKTLSAAERAGNARAFTALDGFFDQEALKTRPIAQHSKAMTPAQAKTFGETFYSLIRLVAFPDSGAFFRKAKWSVKAGKVAGDVLLHAEIVADDVETDLIFHWRPVDGALRIADVSFDGSSMMKDYGNQFGRILAKHQAAGLLAKLKKRLEAETRARKGLLP